MRKTPSPGSQIAFESGLGSAFEPTPAVARADNTSQHRDRFDLLGEGRPRYRNGDQTQLRDDAVLAGGEQADALGSGGCPARRGNSQWRRSECHGYTVRAAMSSSVV